MRVRVLWLAALALAHAGQASAAAAQNVASAAMAQKTDWPTYGFDALRTGHNPLETTLGPANVAGLAQAWSFAPGPFELAVDSTVVTSNALLRGQPVLAHKVDIAGTKTDLLVAGDENGFLFALDANSTKKTGTVVWYNSLGRRTVAGCPGTTRIVGIQSAATIDRAANGGKGAVFVAFNGAVHALDLTTGAELSNWPVAIPSIANEGTDGYSHDAINAVGGELYVGTSSNCDNSPYYGRLLRISIANATVQGVYYPLSNSATQPTLSGAGIWGPGGAAVDASVKNGGVYIATGNAIATNTQTPYAENIVDLRRDLSRMVGASTPSIPVGDNDYGATPIVFQPTGCTSKLLAVPNKIGLLVVDKIRPAGALQQWQTLQMANNTTSFRGSAAWDETDQLLLVTTPTDGPAPYLHGLSALRANASCTSLSLAWQSSPPAMLGPPYDPFSPVTIANGVVYMGVEGTSEKQVFAIAATTSGTTTAGQILWTSPALSGVVVAPPMVVNGRLYVASLGKVYAFAPAVP